MKYYTTVSSPVGKLFLACRNEQLTGLWLEGQKHFPDLSDAIAQADHPLFLQVRQWLQEYFLQQRPDPARLPLNPEGSEFQKTIWEQLLKIPYGQTATYGQLAKAIGKPRASQAVGGAVGKNPISIIIPCHRVIGSDGSLTGFAGGLSAKTFLLQLEGVL